MLKPYDSQPNLPMVRAAAIATPQVISHRNLDLCLLAVCSCALTLLCHQAANLSHSSSAATQANPSMTQVEMSLKAGWFAQQKSEEDGQLEEA
ncbi:MAG: hypothetical protein WBA43_10080 [Elainellaceae cyanobacterium]